jgi:hypothetical protein
MHVLLSGLLSAVQACIRCLHTSLGMKPNIMALLRSWVNAESIASKVCS